MHQNYCWCSRLPSWVTFSCCFPLPPALHSSVCCHSLVTSHRQSDLIHFINSAFLPHFKQHRMLFLFITGNFLPSARSFLLKRINEAAVGNKRLRWWEQALKALKARFVCGLSVTKGHGKPRKTEEQVNFNLSFVNYLVGIAASTKNAVSFSDVFSSWSWFTGKCHLPYFISKINF